MERGSGSRDVARITSQGCRLGPSQVLSSSQIDPVSLNFIFGEFGESGHPWSWFLIPAPTVTGLLGFGALRSWLHLNSISLSALR